MEKALERVNWKVVAIAGVAALSVGAALYVATSTNAAQPSASKKSFKKTKDNSATIKNKDKNQQVAKENQSVEISLASVKKSQVETPSENSVIEEELHDGNEGPIVHLPKTGNALDDAKAAKNLGNKLFGDRKFLEAIKYYTAAIELAPKVAVYYNNRAACHGHLENYDQVIVDCTDALIHDPMYAKALKRRAGAYELKKEYKFALNGCFIINLCSDYSALCVLEEFKDQNTMACADRVLKEIGTQQAQILLKTKEQKLPSDTFIKAYFESFRQTSSLIPSILSMTPISDADSLFMETITAISEEKYSLAMEKCEQSIENGGFSAEFDALAYNLRVDSAMEDFKKTIDMDSKNVDAYLKKAAVFMELGNYEAAIAEFELAEKVDPEAADFYYHRGQVRHLTNDLKGAIEDFKRAVELDISLIYAQIQLGVAYYKHGDVPSAVSTFEDAQLMFPKRSEVQNYLGEIYLDQGNEDIALKCFDKSINMQPDSALPYLNKAMLFLQARNDAVEAEKLFKKAIELDPTSEIAYGPLAQLYLTQNRISEAVDIYNQAIDIARTEQELVAAICCREAALAQLNIAGKYPEIMKKLVDAQMAAAAAANHSFGS